MIAGFRLALGFLTVIPVPATATVGRSEARAAMLLGSLAVLPVALAAAGLGWAAATVGLSSLLAGTIVVAVTTLGTRAMHLDGLADTVDGLGSGPDREKALRVMRSGDVGPMGVVALVLVLLTQAAGFGVLLERPLGWLQAAAVIAAARAALALGCIAGVPSARPDGLGALFAGSVPRPAVAVLWLLTAAALGGAGQLAGQPWWQGVVASAVALTGAAVLLGRCVRRFGGVTGDVLGALVEATLALLVLSLAV